LLSVKPQRPELSVSRRRWRRASRDIRQKCERRERREQSHGGLMVDVCNPMMLGSMARLHEHLVSVEQGTSLGAIDQHMPGARDQP
jgi:hypothetical protein